MLSLKPLKTWTPESEERLKQEWGNGPPTRQIAAILTQEFNLPFTKNAIISKARRLGLPNRAPTGRERIRNRAKRQAQSQVAKNIENGEYHLRGLKDNQCRYPFGLSPYSFCGETIVPGSSYCPEHHLLCWKDPDWKRKQ